jgi:hypothetical protein
VPTESTFNTTTVFRSNMQGSGCVSNAHVLSYKTFGGQHLNDSQWELFDLYPDIVKISREEDLFVVNFADETTIKWVPFDRNSLHLTNFSATNSYAQ